jgi:dienelactone hydrolase
MLPGQLLEQYVSGLIDSSPRRLSLEHGHPIDPIAWQAELYDEFVRLIGIDPVNRPSVEAEVLREEQMDGYVRRYVHLKRSDGMVMPAYLLVPDAIAHGADVQAPGLLALHGHGSGKVVVTGIPEDYKGRPRELLVDDDYAVQGAKRGYITLAPDQVGFGELQFPEDLAQELGSSCMQFSMRCAMAGTTTIGQRVLEAMVCLDYLASLPNVNADRLVVVGLSGGGTTTLYTGVVDKRVWATVPTCYFCTFRASILAMAHCVCNFVPRLLDVAEMYDLAALIAPRLLYIISGVRDGIFPIEGVNTAYDYVERFYQAMGAEANLSRYDGDGEHRFYSAEVWDWLAARL